MGFLFLDIESFVAPDDERSGLNPFHEKSAVFAISYNYYNLKIAPIASEIKKPSFLYEWDLGGEKPLLEHFYSILRDIYQKDSMLKIIGFNHLAYDLPFLFARMQKPVPSQNRTFALLRLRETNKYMSPSSGSRFRIPVTSADNPSYPFLRSVGWFSARTRICRVLPITTSPSFRPKAFAVELRSLRR